MKLYLSGRILEWQNPTPDSGQLIALARDANYDGIGIRPWQVREGESLVRRLDAAGLTACSVTTRLEDLDQAIALANATGAKVIQLDVEPDALGTAAARLGEGLRMGPQLHSGRTFETLTSSHAALEAIGNDRLGVILDPANLQFAQIAWDTPAFAPLQRWIIGCNLQSVTVGSGSRTATMSNGRTVHFDRALWRHNTQADLRGFLRVLNDIGYRGYFCVTEMARRELSTAELAQCCAEDIRQAGAFA